MINKNLINPMHWEDISNVTDMICIRYSIVELYNFLSLNLTKSYISFILFKTGFSL